MTLSKLFALLIFAIGIQTTTFSQGLDKICPLYLEQGKPEGSLSFLLTATDYNFFRNKPNQFDNNIQIVDADQPWPPRWFAAMPFDSSLGLPYAALVPLNASYQNQKFSFLSIIKTKGKNNAPENLHGFIICDSNMAITDTFTQPNHDLDLDHHDFQIRPNGEKLFFALHDTVIDMTAIHHNTKDTALNLFYEAIEIADSAGHICFTWDPFKQLGAEAPYKKYWNVKGFWNRPNIFDWSHGNSLCFDDDGDILYSYKFIGIGKISRKDGHIIWRVDRTQTQPNLFSDSLPLYLQHDFKSNTDEKGNRFYSFLSNGDQAYKQCSVYQFTVKDTLNGVMIFRTKKRYFPAEKTPNTGGGGNYDVEKNGNYIFNYGNFKSDSIRTLFDYRNGNDKILARYTIAPYILAYRVHKLSGWRPARPAVKQNKGSLSVDQKYDGTWYLLDNENHKATVAGQGNNFKPEKAGVYCVAVKYGFGYSVSKPVSFAK